MHAINSEVQIVIYAKNVHLPGIIESNLVFPATLVLIRIPLSLHGIVSAKMPFGQKASLKRFTKSATCSGEVIQSTWSTIFLKVKKFK